MFALKLSQLPQEIYNTLRSAAKATTRKNSDASLRAAGAGAATTRLASKPRARKAVKPLGWSISLVGGFYRPEA